MILSYRPPSPGDGAGAQCQRIISIYSCAKANLVGYKHNGILDLGPNAGDSFLTIEDRHNFLKELNKLIELPNDKSHNLKIFIKVDKIPGAIYPALRFVNRLLNLIKVTVEIKVEQVYNFMDRNTQEYERALHLIRQNFKPNPIIVPKLIIDCHIRRSTNPPQLKNGLTNPRYTPTSWYLNIVKEIKSQAGIGREILIRIHTDNIPDKIFWEPPADISSGTLEYWESIGVLNNSGKLILVNEDFVEKFKEYGEVIVIQNIDPIEAWKIMVGADILLMGKSSMSYFAALLRGTLPVIFAQFWHSPIATWLEIEEKTELSQTSKRAIKSLLTEFVEGRN